MGDSFSRDHHDGGVSEAKEREEKDGNNTRPPLEEGQTIREDTQRGRGGSSVEASPNIGIPDPDLNNEEKEEDMEFYGTPCKLQVLLVSTQTGEKREEEINMPRYPRRGLDLKEYLETRYRIPTCVQQVQFYGITIDDSTVLRNLRLQHGDTLHVRYPISVDIEYFSRLINTLTRINEILGVVIPALLNGEEITDEMHDLIEGDCLSFTGDSIPLKYFSVYPTGVPNANQLYFIHNNGLHLLLQLYKNMHRLPWHGLPMELQELEFSCLQIVWNFSATLGIRQLILQNGVMEEVFQSLMRTRIEPYHSVRVLDPLRDSYASLERSTYMLAETIYAAIVVIGNFAEVPQCRVPIASRSGVISNMIAAMLSKTYTHTCARSGMCALLCLSFSPETHQYLCEDSLLNRIIEICNRIDRVNDGTGLNEKTVNKTLVEFYALIFFANLIRHWNPDSPLSPVFLSTVVDFMKRYTTNVTYDIIQRRMQEKRYYWSTFIPFLSLCYSPEGISGTIGTSGGRGQGEEKERVREGEGGESRGVDSLADLHQLCISAGLLSMKCMCVAENAEEVIGHEGLLDYIVCIPWFVPGEEMRSSARELVELARQSLGRLQPPSLTNIVKAFLAAHCCGLEKTLKRDVHSVLLEMDKDYI